ncbi:hypothetical protein PYCC9005_004134 [Savitreella phatthalungensis]
MLFSNCFVVLGLASSAWAGVSEDIAAAGKFCAPVNLLVNGLGSAPASSAHAFCNNYLGVKPTSTVTVSASAVTTTTVSTCPGVASSSTASLVKRGATLSPFVRTPGPPCPTFLTAIGPAALSTACSCLTSVTTTTATVTPTSTVTRYQQSTSTFTSTVTVQATPVFSYSTATLVSTTTTTDLSSTTSTVTDTADVMVTTTVTPTVTSTLTQGDTVTVTSSVTPTSSAQNLGKRTAPASAAPAASSLPVNNCKVVVVTTVVTVTSTSTSTIASTTTATSTLVTSSTVATATTSTTTRTVSTVTDTATASTVVVTVRPTHTAVNYLKNGDFEDTAPLSSTWQVPSSDATGRATKAPGRGVDGSTAVELTSSVEFSQQVQNVPNLQYLKFSYAGLQSACTLMWYYESSIGRRYPNSVDPSPSYDTYTTTDPVIYDAQELPKSVIFTYSCPQGQEAPVLIDNVFFGTF